MGKKAHFKIKAYDLEWGDIMYYDSVKEASQELEIPAPNIYKNLDGRSKETHNHRFEKWEELNDKM